MPKHCSSNDDPSMRGCRSRNDGSGQLRLKRGDTLAATIEQQYGVELGVRRRNCGADSFPTTMVVTPSARSVARNAKRSCLVVQWFESTAATIRKLKRADG